VSIVIDNIGSKCSQGSRTTTATFSSRVSVRTYLLLLCTQTTPDPALLWADDKVRPLDDEEAALFRLLESVTQRSAASLMSRWREPSLTIHGVRGSGPHNPTVIPASVTAQVSLRIVPDQVLDTVCTELIQHLRASFDALNSANTIKVKLFRIAVSPMRLATFLVVLIFDAVRVGDCGPHGRLVARRSDAPLVP